MNRVSLHIVLVLMTAIFLSCTKPVPESPEPDVPVVENPADQDNVEGGDTGDSNGTDNSGNTDNTDDTNKQAMTIDILIGNKTFQADIEDSETGKAFYALLPMKLSMTELNGNEKYHYLSSSLPTKAQYYGSISAGDLMLYGGNCVVLFYGSAGGFSYTRIGKLKSTNGLSAAVGSGNVTVEFKKVEADQ